MSTKTILLVEDNPDDEVLTLRALRKHNLGNKVLVARDGAEALDYLVPEDPGAREPSVLPQLILLDLKLPKVDGLEVLRRVRANEQTCLLPIVVLTSSREERDLEECYRLGANSYIRKPVDFEKLIETTLQLGVYWLDFNEAPPSVGGP